MADCWTDHSWGRYPGDELSAWQLAMPWHPDVVAVHALPEVALGNEDPDADLTGLLSVVAGTSGPARRAGHRSAVLGRHLPQRAHQDGRC